LIRFVASAAIAVWGLTMVLLGIVNGMLSWIAIGLAVTAFGAPLLASNPMLTARLYPLRNEGEGSSASGPR
jgi:hypothetical protein